MTKLAQWTIMIYANGNNDLEPEMWQAKLAAEKACFGDSVTVVLQIGREDAALVNILRPGQVTQLASEYWTGVRRYLLAGGKAVLLEDLGKKNMADPRCLYEFVKATTSSFPADRYMLILGGHGYQFVGSMPDYSLEAPYIMGIPGMARALDQACGEQESKIDILIADICYFNFIEVIYEFATHANHAVRNVLTYICDGPIGGMPYEKIIECTQCGYGASSSELMAAFILKINLDLVAITLEHNQLGAIKSAFHKLANNYICNKGSDKISINEVLFVTDHNCPWWPEAQAALLGLESLVIDYKRISCNDYGLLNIANIPSASSKTSSLYSKLKFAQDNAWTYLLSEQTISSTAADCLEDELKPVLLAPEEVYAYIALMNPNLSKEQRLAILRKAIDYKAWYRSTPTE